MRLLSWLVRGFLFFALFAFALNNQHSASLHWFFGLAWQAPMVFIVLGAFGVGAACGVLAMLVARAGPWRARHWPWPMRFDWRLPAKAAAQQTPTPTPTQTTPTSLALRPVTQAPTTTLDGADSKDPVHGI